MRKLILPLLLILFTLSASAQEYKVVTIVESIVPGGLGRSRMIENKGDIDAGALTTENKSGKSKQKNVKRSDAKIDSFEETKLLNFYSLTGINLSNIAPNDALITSKINELTKKGWKLMFVTSGV